MKIVLIPILALIYSFAFLANNYVMFIGDMTGITLVALILLSVSKLFKKMKK